MTDTITTWPAKTWLEAMTERFNDLETRVLDERRNLSAFRAAEAETLALTKEEAAELHELERLLCKLELL